jgi:hypothetical protein
MKTWFIRHGLRRWERRYLIIVILSADRSRTSSRLIPDEGYGPAVQNYVFAVSVRTGLTSLCK